ncbi:MAG: hypothetical protein HKP30_01390 [Myxococcales bacterium]|nr:hypothetical protein [Myxococcales bacterium]
MKVLLAMIVLAGVLFVRVNAERFENGEYQHPKAGFAVQFPDGWDESDVPYATFAVASPDSEDTCVVLVQDVPRSVTAEDLMKGAERRGAAARYERLSQQPTRVGGVDGYRSESRMRVGGEGFRNSELHLVRDGTAVTVQCLGSEETFDARFLTYSRVLDSFRWND